MKRPSRRQFLATTATSAAGLLAMKATPAWARTAAKAGVATPQITPPISTFNYSQVQLLEGPFKLQFEQNHKLFLDLNEDGMLRPFRVREGLPAPGPDMGGWYDDGDDFDPKTNFHAFIAGHTFGQYVSGLARAYAVTGDKATQAKVHRLVAAFRPTLTEKIYKKYFIPPSPFQKT